MIKLTTIPTLQTVLDASREKANGNRTDSKDSCELAALLDTIQLIGNTREFKPARCWSRDSTCCSVLNYFRCLRSRQVPSLN